MNSLLGRYLNKTIRLSIPILFPDGRPCVAALLAIEPAGVWLESDTLREAVDLHESTRIFIPFAQIAYIVEETRHHERAEPGRAHPERPDHPEAPHHPQKAHPDKPPTKEEPASPAKPKRPGHGGAPRSKHR
jgi:hypothetical protein